MQAVECDELSMSGACLPRNQQHHRQHIESASKVTAVRSQANVTTPSASGRQTLSAYLQEHTELHSNDKMRLRQLMQWSELFNTTSAAGHSGVINWYQNHDDVLFEQPISFIWETNDTKQWIPKDTEWHEVHERLAEGMERHKVIVCNSCLLSLLVARCCPDLSH